MGQKAVSVSVIVHHGIYVCAIPTQCETDFLSNCTATLTRHIVSFHPTSIPPYVVVVNGANLICLACGLWDIFIRTLRRVMLLPSVCEEVACGFNFESNSSSSLYTLVCWLLADDDWRKGERKRKEISKKENQWKSGSLWKQPSHYLYNNYMYAVSWKLILVAKQRSRMGSV